MRHAGADDGHAVDVAGHLAVVAWIEAAARYFHGARLRLFIRQADLVSSLRSGLLSLISRPMPGAKIFNSTKDILTGIEPIHMIRNCQLAVEVVMLCLFPTSLIRWQDKSAQCQVLEKTHLLNLLCAG